MRRGLTAVLAATALGAGCGGGEETVQLPVPLVADSSPFAYPLALWDQNLEGETTLLVHVTPQGAVDSARVLYSSGFAEFDSAALAGAPSLRFVPGRLNDRAAGMYVRVPVRFHRDAGAGAAAERPTGSSPDTVQPPVPQEERE